MNLIKTESVTKALIFFDLIKVVTKFHLQNIAHIHHFRTELLLG